MNVLKEHWQAQFMDKKIWKPQQLTVKDHWFDLQKAWSFQAHP